MRGTVAILLLAAAFAGCRIERHLLAQPGESQAVRVESGDRFYFTLPEDDATESRWDFTCDDADVEVRIDHDDGEASVRIRIHRGYDGPSTIRFFCRRPDRKEPVKTFVISLFKRPGDHAFWE